MLNEGKGGFINYSEYRETLTAIVWRGEMPEQTPEQKADATKELIGKPTPTSALNEARALFEASKQRQQDEKK